MKKVVLYVAVVSVLVSFAGPAAFPNGNPVDGVSISPQTLLLSWEQSGSVTVHTNIPLVGQPSVTLEGIPARVVFADSRGELVAKFSEAAVEAVVAPPEATLTLCVDGVDVGSDTVRVIE